ncbi:hypothetical protein ACQQ2N_20665 [Dokdonella sp. MW10]|uniref:hypothetical protein n=1 Tax=Dokdonella sp. MW10 TaxID=2992926 RepID=UPI003F80CDF3
MPIIHPARKTRARATPRFRFAVMLAGTALAALPSAQAATFLVDTTSDDGSAAFQLCDADATNANCSLRGAITAMNASAGPHTITFAIPQADPGYIAATAHWRFSPTTAYPFITRELVIDGYTQPGAVPNTNTTTQGGSNAVLRIEIAGPGRAAQIDGLNAINGVGSSAALTVRGLAINRFFRNISLYNAGSHRIEGCFIGSDITGTNGFDSAQASWMGIVQGGGALQLGGTTPAARNLVSGNLYMGLWQTTAGPLTVQGNLFGTTAAGTADLPRQDYGIQLGATGVGASIGGSADGAGNLFGANRFGAIYVNAQVPAGMANPVPLRILGNILGTDTSGTVPLGNGLNPGSPSQPQSTIFVFGGGRCGVAIGGDAPGEGNRIANGGAAGVLVANCTNAPVLGNRFTGNRGGALDLSLSSNGDGPTPNDAGDADEGGNRLQNHPVMTSFSCSAGTCTLGYRVDTAVANATYPLRVDVMVGRGGQPEAAVATDTVLAAEAGTTRTVTFASAALQGGALILSATDAVGNTSEFGGEHLFATGFE